MFEINEVVLFVPSVTEDIFISAENGNLGILEIVMELSENDLHYLKKQQSQFPYYITYSQCRQYKESIKSEKTINRILLPENIVPRFCMGSVETSGPDEVGAHSHPMLEQLFFGLANNNCIVRADSQETTFEENYLLHIPLGSVHGVRSEEGKTLNYIWMDFFRSQEDMDYITDSHIMEEE